MPGNALSLLPPLHGAGDVKQVAGMVRQDVVVLAADLIVANQAPTNRALQDVDFCLTKWTIDKAVTVSAGDPSSITSSTDTSQPHAIE